MLTGPLGKVPGLSGRGGQALASPHAVTVSTRASNAKLSMSRYLMLCSLLVTVRGQLMRTHADWCNAFSPSAASSGGVCAAVRAAGVASCSGAARRRMSLLGDAFCLRDEPVTVDARERKRVREGPALGTTTIRVGVRDVRMGDGGRAVDVRI